jgi:hypothetical protein
MAANMLERGQAALNDVPKEHLDAVVRWLELLARLKDQPDIEPEELWLLATGALEKMNEEMKDAQPIDNWQTYLIG